MQKSIAFLFYLASSATYALSDLSPALTSDHFYVGLGIGSEALDFKTSVTGITSTQREHFGQSDLLGNVVLGYNHNMNPWFNLGLDVFYSFYNITTTLTEGNSFGSSVYKTNGNYGIKFMPAINLKQYARLFLDIGVTGGHFIFNTSALARQLGAPSSYSTNLAGLMLGGGIEVALTQHLSVRGEYQNISFKPWNISTTLTRGQIINTHFQNTENQFIASLIYHFG